MDITILLLVGIASMAFVAYEVAALTFPGWHTISFYAHVYRPLRMAITIGLLLGAGWFWWHASRPIPK